MPQVRLQAVASRGKNRAAVALQASDTPVPIVRAINHRAISGLTIRSSRVRFAASALALRLSQRRGRSPARLNSGVRLRTEHLRGMNIFVIVSHGLSNRLLQ